MTVLYEWVLLDSPMLVSRPSSTVSLGASVLALRIRRESLDLSNGFVWQLTKLLQVHPDRVVETAVEVVRDRKRDLNCSIVLVLFHQICLIRLTRCCWLHATVSALEPMIIRRWLPTSAIVSNGTPPSA